MQAALLLAVVISDLATVGFGLSTSFAHSFLLLVLCGMADSVSMSVRQTVVQLLTPDDKRGRVSAVNGGLGTILVVIAVALIWPEDRRHGRLVPE